MYANLDQLIFNALKSRPKGSFLGDIYCGNIWQECQRMADETKRESFRVLDGRLQALRKKGVIAYTSKNGWTLK